MGLTAAELAIFSKGCFKNKNVMNRTVLLRQVHKEEVSCTYTQCFLAVAC